MNAEQWNKQFKIGTRVAAYPDTRDDQPLITRTRSEAWTLGHGEAVVLVVGHVGGIILSHVDSIEHTPMTADDIAAQALSDAGAFCGECGFEPGQRGCPACERVWANYVAVLRATGWAPRAEALREGADAIQSEWTRRANEEITRFGGSVDHETTLQVEAVTEAAKLLRQKADEAKTGGAE